MKYGALSERGRREHNEDSYYIPADGHTALAAVADGMGGHKAGSTASTLAIETLVSDIERGGESDPERLILRAVRAANAAVYAKSKSGTGFSGMGTTLVLALPLEGRYVAANIGDSRLYHYSNGELRRVSRDHSYVEELVEAGYITREQAASHPRRNVITRAVGTDPDERADIFKSSWKRGDVLMLCTDGLSGTLTDEDMCRVLREEEDINAACRRLVEEALYGGSTDNISVVLVLNEEE